MYLLILYKLVEVAKDIVDKVLYNRIKINSILYSLCVLRYFIINKI